jgi:hypothetical protein
MHAYKIVERLPFILSYTLRASLVYFGWLVPGIDNHKISTYYTGKLASIVI